MPLSPLTYASMLGKRLEENKIDVFLVNTGWIGGSATSGTKRIRLEYTRAMVNAAMQGKLDNVEYKHNDILNLDFPTSCVIIQQTFDFWYIYVAGLTIMQ